MFDCYFNWQKSGREIIHLWSLAPSSSGGWCSPWPSSRTSTTAWRHFRRRRTAAPSRTPNPRCLRLKLRQFLRSWWQVYMWTNMIGICLAITKANTRSTHGSISPFPFPLSHLLWLCLQLPRLLSNSAHSSFDRILFSHLKQGGVNKPFPRDLCFSSTLALSLGISEYIRGKFQASL